MVSITLDTPVYALTVGILYLLDRHVRSAQLEAQLAQAKLERICVCSFSRSAIVNLDRIEEMQPWFHGERRVVLKDGAELTWTRSFRPRSSPE